MLFIDIIKDIITNKNLSEEDKLEECRLLIESGANVNDKDNNSMTALMLASIKGYENIVKLLIESGTNVNEKNYDGYTALMWASINGHKNIVKLLIESGANLVKNMIDY